MDFVILSPTRVRTLVACAKPTHFLSERAEQTILTNTATVRGLVNRIRFYQLATSVQ